MTDAVADASLGVKWFVPEILSNEANQWRDAVDQWHTLNIFFDIEIGNVLWKKIRRAEILLGDANRILLQLSGLPMQRHSEALLLPVALDLAHRTSRTVYDCLYLALALRLGAPVVTADERFVNSLSGTPWEPHIRWVGSPPSVP
ncbi:MAG: type II toxin-antitoxin system VapC family toxin [Planctomycetaceae bacterium]